MNFPCLITFIRIIGTILMLFVAPFSAVFYLIYTISGSSDALDGYVARKLNQSTEFGAKLDSVADILFYLVMILRIFPVLISKVSIGIWCAVGVVVFVRIASYVVAAIKYKCFASLHTYMNKLTGILVFFIPYAVNFKLFFVFCILIVAVAGTASLEELIIHIRSKEYNQNTKTLFNIA